MENKKRTISIIGIFALVLAVIGGTLAYWTWTTNAEQQTNVVFTVTSDFSCAADGGGNITSGDIVLAPTTCTDTTRAIKRKITVTPTINRNDLTISMDLWLDINDLGEGLSESENFKYVLTTSDNSCEEGTIMASGTFYGKTENSKVNLLTGQTYISTSIVPEEYWLYIWLDSAETSSDTMDQTFSLSLNGICTDRPGFVVPEGATYTTNIPSEYTGGDQCQDYTNAVKYEAGDVIYFEPSTCDTYTYDGLKYIYNAESWAFEIYAYNMNGWGVVRSDYNKKTFGDILSSINGKDVVSMRETFYGASSVESVGTIPSTIKNMNSTFSYATNLTGTIVINANPTSYDGTFGGTSQSITLAGSSTMLDELASTATNDNVKVAFMVPDGAVYIVGAIQEYTTGITGDSTTFLCGSSGKRYVAGDIVDVEPSTCDMYSDESYDYYYNSSNDGYGIAVPDSNGWYNGWTVFNPVLTNGVAGKILSSINGKDVVSLRYTFKNNSQLVTAPTIPHTILDMTSTFEKCQELTGTIEINASPIFYGSTFYYTSNQITLIGTSTLLNELAATANGGNVTVGN